MASIRKRPGGQYRARYRDPAGKEHARHFARKVDAQRWSAPSGRPGARWTACRMVSGTTDLRHYFASLLIASGTDVKTVQARLRHASAKTTLDTYGHLWPDRDESTRAAVDAVSATRVANPADSVRTSGPAHRSRRRSGGT
jgi:integrase